MIPIPQYPLYSASLAEYNMAQVRLLCSLILSLSLSLSFMVTILMRIEIGPWAFQSYPQPPPPSLPLLYPRLDTTLTSIETEPLTLKSSPLLLSFPPFLNLPFLPRLDTILMRIEFGSWTFQFFPPTPLSLSFFTFPPFV